MIRACMLVAIGSLGLFFAIGVRSHDASGHSSGSDETAQREADAFVKAGDTDGLSIAIVSDGRASYVNAGTTIRGKARAPDKDTVYEIGSVSKTFTSLLLAHALIEKKLALDDDIRRYLPGSYPGLEFEGKPVTLRELVATTSGLPDNLPDFMGLLKTERPEQAPFAIARMLERYPPAQFLEDLRKFKLTSRPGTATAHSNVAPELLGLILEKVYGGPYRTLLAACIEQPAGMASGVDANRLARLADGYMVGDKPMPRISEIGLILAAGGLRYSAGDLARYVKLQLDAADPAVALTHRPLWGDPGHGAIGFDWVIARTPGGQPRLSHDGGTLGFSSFVDLYPQAHWGVVLLANRSGPATQDQLRALSERLARAAGIR